MSKNNHNSYMKLALKLAGKASPSPNPGVGCVIVKDSRIVGKGFHEKSGMPHAEIIALRNAGNKAEGAIMYVSLEPCCFYGKTPPCTNAIIKAGIKQVVIACPDQNPAVSGKGISILKKAGIKIKTGVLEKEAIKLNEAFFKFVKTGTLFISIKAAISSDGKISYKGKKKWITGISARTYAHKLRAEHDAVLVGINTVLSDNPRLTTRHVRGKNPLRVVLDSKLRLPANSRVLSDKNVLIVASKDYDKNKKNMLIKKGYEILIIGKNKKENKEINLTALMKQLGKKNITSLLVEGGQDIWSSALREHIADKAYLFFSPARIGKGKSFIKGLNTKEKIIKALKLKNIKETKTGKDLLIEGYV